MSCRNLLDVDDDSIDWLDAVSCVWFGRILISSTSSMFGLPCIIETGLFGPVFFLMMCYIMQVRSWQWKSKKSLLHVGNESVVILLRNSEFTPIWMWVLRIIFDICEPKKRWRPQTPFNWTFLMLNSGKSCLQRGDEWWRIGRIIFEVDYESSRNCRNWSKPFQPSIMLSHYHSTLKSGWKPPPFLISAKWWWCTHASNMTK